MFLVNLRPLHPHAKSQPLFCASSKTGNGPDIQGLFDQIVTKIQMQIPVPAISFDDDSSYNFCRDKRFSSGGSTGVETMAEISTSYSIRWMRRMERYQNVILCIWQRTFVPDFSNIFS
jgi:hypothetical protein